MACLHKHLSSPTTVSLCLDTGDYNCCPNEYQTMIVCGDCGEYKIISVESVCEECCLGDIHIWDNYLNKWYPANNQDFNLTNYSVYQTALNEAQITPILNFPKFMIKGYHYTKPTDPVNVNSCRLYFDNQIETSSVNNDIWIAPNTGVLEGINQELMTEEIPTMDLLSWSIPLSSSIAPSSNIYICFNSTNNVVLFFEENYDYYNTISYADNNFTTTISYNANLKQVDINQDGIVDGLNTFYIQYYVNTNYKLHLKGFHNFFVQS